MGTTVVIFCFRFGACFAGDRGFRWCSGSFGASSSISSETRRRKGVWSAFWGLFVVVEEKRGVGLVISSARQDACKQSKIKGKKGMVTGLELLAAASLVGEDGWWYSGFGFFCCSLAILVRAWSSPVVLVRFADCLAEILELYLELDWVVF
ncbi:hypothetical protein R3W88_028085 [Solanum pinnatisectum]|uniref:Uncharacterized protein n=1 Tax=Solanum pinnatisectum TaxID=50273 RepID=A0AAV9LHX2_9SOLN|nr:hypothetical protein R3W88_028085 [Solanum pinnatisectum]